MECIWIQLASEKKKKKYFRCALYPLIHSRVIDVLIEYQELLEFIVF